VNSSVNSNRFAACVLARKSQCFARPVKKYTQSLILGSLVLAFLLAWYFFSRPERMEKVVVANPVGSVTAGYPFALQIKNRIGRDAHLYGALVELDRGAADDFHVGRISYDFFSTAGNGRLFTITVDNTNRETYAGMDSADVPELPLHVSAWAALDISGVHEVAEVLAIARTNGLDEFCAWYPGETGAVGLKLREARPVPIWRLSGIATVRMKKFVVLEIELNARTGEVLSRELKKPPEQR
jgi:hypothetical protein